MHIFLISFVLPFYKKEKHELILFSIAASFRFPPNYIITSYARSISGISCSSLLAYISLNTGEWNLLTKIDLAVPCILCEIDIRVISPSFLSSLSLDSEMNLMILVKILMRKGLRHRSILHGFRT